MSFFIGLILGIILGGIIGTFTMAVCIASKDSTQDYKKK